MAAAWQYWDGGAWQSFDVLDHSHAFTRDGAITLVVPPQARPRRDFVDGRPSYWLRAISPEDEREWIGAVHGLLINTVMAAHRVTFEVEVLGSSRATPNQVFRILRTSVLEGEVLELPHTHPAARLGRRLTMRAYMEYVAETLLRRDASPGEPGAAYRILAQAMGNDLEALAAVLRGDGSEAVSVAALHDVTAPVLVLNGRDDPAHLATARLREVLPTARVAICAGDHLSAPWQPSFQQAVVDFLTRALAGAPAASRSG